LDARFFPINDNSDPLFSPPFLFLHLFCIRVFCGGRITPSGFFWPCRPLTPSYVAVEQLFSEGLPGVAEPRFLLSLASVLFFFPFFCALVVWCAFVGARDSFALVSCPRFFFFRLVVLLWSGSAPFFAFWMNCLAFLLFFS